jgi:hypothetical protein
MAKPVLQLRYPELNGMLKSLKVEEALHTLELAAAQIKERNFGEAAEKLLNVVHQWRKELFVEM